MDKPRFYNTLIEMLNQREYKNIEDDEDGHIFCSYEKKDICVFYKILCKLNIAELKSIIQFLETKDIKHAIIVLPSDNLPTPAVKNFVQNAISIGLKIEFFDSQDLFFNITKHRLVPEHKKLTKEQAKEIKNKYGLNLPVILKSDAISVFYDFSKGDIIKITRKNRSIMYRIVK